MINHTETIAQTNVMCFAYYTELLCYKQKGDFYIQRWKNLELRYHYYYRTWN